MIFFLFYSGGNGDDHDDDDVDDDNHRFQIIIAIVNEALREVIQFEEPVIDNNDWLVSMSVSSLPKNTNNKDKIKLNQN